MKLFSRLFARKPAPPIKWSPVAVIPSDVRLEPALEDVLPEAVKPADAELEAFARKMLPYAFEVLPECRKPIQYMLCRWETVSRSTCSTATEYKGRCLSSLPCKYKGSCAGAPKVDQEV